MDRDDAGFTLVELLIAFFLMTVVFGVTAAIFDVGLKSSKESDDRVAESTDAEILTTFLTRDIASADLVGPAVVPCGGAGWLQASWLDGATAHRVTYRSTSTPTGHLVTRSACTATTGPVDQVVARRLSGAPSTTCTPAPCARPERIAIQVSTVTGASFRVQGTPRRSL